MSFSQDIKDDILAKEIEKECCIEAERYGELITSPAENDLSIAQIHRMLGNKCCVASFLKGVFLGSGCIADPETEYHLEIILPDEARVEIVSRFLKKVKLRPKYIERQNGFVIYIKEADQISTFLSVIQANKSKIAFEQVRVEKDVKNNLNRYINCEMANIAKTAATSVKQIDAINYLRKVKLFDSLPDTLKEAAILREKHSNDSLEELASKAKEKVSKSGMNHRLNKLLKMAEEHKKMQGEK